MGIEQNSDDRIALEFGKFYQRLYTPEEGTLQDSHSYLYGCNLQPLQQTASESLDSEIQLEEVMSAIAWLTVAKYPGPDGFSAFFFIKHSVMRFLPS